MELIAIALTALMLVHPKRMITEAREDTFISGTESLTIHKSDVPTIKDSYHVIEQKLKQHRQALEKLLLITEKNDDLMKKLMQTLAQDPEKPDKVEVFPSRRNNVIVGDINTFKNNEEDTGSILLPIITFVNDVSRNGRLFVHVISDEIKTQLKPLT